MANFSLLAKLGLDTGAFQRGLKGAESKTKGFTKTLGTLRGALALGAFVTAAKNVATFVKEMENAAKLANLSTEEFQRFAFAAKTVGIEQEKAADILKDVSDKVGDFLSTGAGGMADFFEQIAPKIGVTADQFRNLNGRDALQLYVSSLEKANVSQNEMTFYMEAIASDATALLPLLKQNGEELENLANQADRVGAVMNKKTTEAIKRTADSFDQAKTAALALGAKAFTFLQERTEDVLATGASLITQENVLGALHRKRALEVLSLNKAYKENVELVHGAVLANKMFSEIFAEDLSLPDFEEKMAGEKKIKDAVRQRKMNTEANRIKLLELENLRALSKGEDERAKKIQRQIELSNKALEIAKKFGLSIAQAQKMVRGMELNKPSKEIGETPTGLEQKINASGGITSLAAIGGGGRVGSLAKIEESQLKETEKQTKVLEKIEKNTKAPTTPTAFK